MNQASNEKLAARAQNPLAAAWYQWADSKGYDTIREVTARLDMPKFEQFYLEVALRSSGDRVMTAPTTQSVSSFTGAPVATPGAVAGAGAKPAAGTPTANVPGATVGSMGSGGGPIGATEMAQMELTLSEQLNRREKASDQQAAFREVFFAPGADQTALRKQYPEDAKEMDRLSQANKQWAANPANAEAADYLNRLKKSGADPEDTKALNKAMGVNSIERFIMQRYYDGEPVRKTIPGGGIAEPTATPQPRAQAVTGQTVLEAAKPLTGLPYGFGSWQQGDRSSIDCSAFVSETVKAATGGAVNLTPQTDYMARETQQVDKSQAQPGDLIFYKYADPSQPGTVYPHVAIYAGGNQVVDARYGATSGQHNLDIGQPFEVRRVAQLGQAGSAAAPATVSPSQAALPQAQATGNWRPYAKAVAAEAGIDPAVFERQIDQENHFSPTGTSPAGAQGIAQIMPQYHPGVNPNNPSEALQYAANLMAQHLETYGGDWVKALVAYNGGGGAVQAWNAGKPYGESVKYVTEILGPEYSTPGGPAFQGGPVPEVQKPILPQGYAAGRQPQDIYQGTAGVGPIDPQELWAGGFGRPPTRALPPEGPAYTGVPVQKPGTIPGGGGVRAPVGPVGSLSPKDIEATIYAQLAANLSAKVNDYYNFGSPEQKALVDKYMAMDTNARTAFRKADPQGYKAFQDTMNARDELGKADPNLWQFLQFNKAMGKAERPEGISSDIEWFLTAKKQGLLPAIIGNMAPGTTIPTTSTPRYGGGGGGKAVVPKGAATGTMGAFVSEAGPGLISDLVKYWGQGTPLSEPAHGFLKALYGKYSFGARSYEEWLAYVLRSQWALWNISNPGGTAAIPAVPVAVPA
jgi:cell wall-associated NlpC family hydrolase